MRKSAQFYRPVEKTSITRQGNQYIFTCGSQHLEAEVSITFYRPDIVRVRARQLTFDAEPISYAVIREAEDIKVDFDASDDQTVLKSADLTVTVQHHPLKITFQDAEGRILNEDDQLGIGWQGNAVTNYKLLQSGERFIGMGEKTGPLDRRGQTYVHWNTDDFAYSPDADPLYLSTPFFIGLHQGLSYGIFLDNTHRSTFNFGASSERFSWFSADQGEMDYYFFAGSVEQIIKSYAWLTGTMPMPPKWSLGYQQCRYSYYPDTELLSVARTFREKNIPADVVYLDIHYMDDYRVFTFHPDRFPDPKGMMDQLKEMGFHVVVIVDPGIKKDEQYKAYQEGKAAGHFLKMPDGEVYHGEVWPGWSAFPDYTNPAAREWWANQFDVYTDAGIDGFWNDMNEPAAWGQSLPNNIEFDWEGEGATLLQARNTYGMLMARATREGVEARLEKRPFVLTRAGFSGVQRYAAIWTGDNVATDEHLMAGIRLLTSLGLAGIPFTGYDVGGFAGEASPRLYSRFIQAGAFSPFFRGHSAVNTRDSEPWSYGEQFEEINRNYIGLRYQLMPYIYSGIYDAAQTGMPLVRSLAMYSQDPAIFSPRFHNQFMFGPSLLVAPVDSLRDLYRVYLPAGKWYDLLTGVPFEGGGEQILEVPIERFPVFAKGGTVIAMQSLVQSLAQKPEDTLELHVYAGGSEVFEMELYDDQDQPDPESDGGFWKQKLEFDGANNRLVLHPNQGEYAGLFSKARLHFHGFGNIESVIVNGHSNDHSQRDFRFVEPISRFDPQGPDTTPILGYSDVPCTTVELGGNETLRIEWKV